MHTKTLTICMFTTRSHYHNGFKTLPTETWSVYVLPITLGKSHLIFCACLIRFTVIQSFLYLNNQHKLGSTINTLQFQ